MTVKNRFIPKRKAVAGICLKTWCVAGKDLRNDCKTVCPDCNGSGIQG